MAWRSRVTELSLLLVEAFWLSALASGIGTTLSSPEGHLNAGSILLIVLSSYYINRFLIRLPGFMVVPRLLSVAAFVLITLAVLQWEDAGFGVPFEPQWLGDVLLRGRTGVGGLQDLIFGGLLAALAWWRGTRPAVEGVDFDSLFGSFRIGVVVIGVVTLFQALVLDEVPVSRLIFPFFASGLMGLALTQIAAREQSLGQLPRHYWLVVALATAGVVVVAGMVLSLLAGSQSISAMGALFGAAGAVLDRVLDVVVVLISYVGVWLARLLFLIFSLLLRVFGRERAEEEPTNLAPPPSFEEFIRDEGEPGAAALVIKWTLAALIIGGILVWLAWTVLRRRRAAGDDEDLFRESLWSEERVRADLASLLGGLVGRFGSRGGAPRPPPSFADAASAAVYALYQRLLALGEALGVVQRGADTPLEHERRLEPALPGPEVGAITDAFERVRYGERVPPESELDVLEQHWSRLLGRHRGHLGPNEHPPEEGASS